MKNGINRSTEKSQHYPSPFSKLLLVPQDSTLSVESDLTGAVGVCKNATLVCGGSCFINVEIGEKAKFICNGSCLGNVVIDKGGFFECEGTMSGDIINSGGSYKIKGEFSGKVFELSLDGNAHSGKTASTDDDEDYDIDEDN